jgi:phosphoribosyl 1,2-cyclic phosphate phosphodiesterase
VSHRVTILGCGSSGGVPRVAGGWGKCDPGNPKNRRLRCSILVERQQGDAITRVLIDTSPDMREQLLAAKADHLDAVLYTHDHADHTHGIDDLRVLFIAGRKRLPVHADERTLTILKQRFDYCFVSPPGSEYPPILDSHVIDLEEDIRIEGAGGSLSVKPIMVQHGAIPALGFRIKNMAYTPDLSAIPASSMKALEGLDLWIIDALRDKPHPSHFSVSEALDAINRFKPKRAVLTNLHTDLDYDELASRLPNGVEPAHDQLVMHFAA